MAIDSEKNREILKRREEIRNIRYRAGSIAKQSLGYSCVNKSKLLITEVPAKLTQLNLEIPFENPRWEAITDAGIMKLRLVIELPDFLQAQALACKAAEIADALGHHPEIRFTWKRVEIWYHSIEMGGLTQDDFIMAARTSIYISK